MKILLATDGSRHAQYAEDMVAALPDSGDADVVVIAVCASPDLHVMGGEIPIPIHEMIDDCRRRSEETLKAATDRVEKWAKSTQAIMVDGHPAHEVLHELEQNEYDLCVLGSHGWTMTERFLLGSVSDRVAKHARCNVLIARPRDNDFDRHQWGHIVIADDGSEPSQHAIERISALPLGKDADILLLSVIQDPFAAGVIPPPTDNSFLHQKAEIGKRQDEICEQLKEATENVTSEIVVSDSVPRQIIKFADERNSDLIVLGGKKKSSIQRFLLGSVSMSVLHHAPCSVWIER